MIMKNISTHKQAKHWTNDEIVQVLVLYCKNQRPGNWLNWSWVFDELQNDVEYKGENGHRMPSCWTGYWTCRRDEDASKQCTGQESLINEPVLELVEEKRNLLNNMLRKKVNWIGQILTRNCLLHDALEGQMTELKG